MLVWKGKSFERTHDLSYLIELCENLGFEFDYIKDKAEIITSYAVDARYPGADKITLKEAQEAFDIAEIIYKFVKNLIKV